MYWSPFGAAKGPISVQLRLPNQGRDKRKISATASVSCFLGPKDDLIAKEATERIPSDLNANVTVASGIHWNDLDEAGIAYVMESSRELVEMLIGRISKEGSR